MPAATLPPTFDPQNICMHCIAPATEITPATYINYEYIDKKALMYLSQIAQKDYLKNAKLKLALVKKIKNIDDFNKAIFIETVALESEITDVFNVTKPWHNSNEKWVKAKENLVQALGIIQPLNLYLCLLYSYADSKQDIEAGNFETYTPQQFLTKYGATI